MYIFSWLVAAMAFVGQGHTSLADLSAPSQTEEEALFLRRIADFWQEGDYALAKQQMEEFLKQFPASSYADPLCAALGDLFLREKSYAKALNYYAKVNQAELQDPVFLNRMQCLYHMQWYATLAEECESYLQQQKNLLEPQRTQVTYYLAISLYQQCLNASKNEEQLQKLIERALPCFETLSQSDLSLEIAEGFAHLSCLAKDFPKAAAIYQNLAVQNPALEEEHLFQAALIQAEYDPELALQTFETIANKGQKKAKEAAYNRFVLAHDLGRHEELIASKESLLQELPEEKVKMVHLFLGQSLYQLKQYPEAVAELLAYIQAEPDTVSLQSASTTLLDAAFKAQDLSALDEAIASLNTCDPQVLPKAYFSKAQLLKQLQQPEEARLVLSDLLTRFPESEQRLFALFELTHLAIAAKDWAASMAHAEQFLQHYPEHQLALYIRRYLATASLALASDHPDEMSYREKLVKDLEQLLSYQEQLPLEEVADWQFFLAKAIYEKGQLEEAIASLEKLLSQKGPFAQQANAKLLLALAYREKQADPALFCRLAQEALAEGASLLHPGQMHLVLFNAYLSDSVWEKAADHLFLAFQHKTEIQEKNLEWLADYSYQQIVQEKEKYPAYHSPRLQETAQVLETLLHTSSQAPLEKEKALVSLAQLYAWLDRPQEAIALLEFLVTAYEEAPLEKKKLESEAKLILAQSYLQTEQAAKALPLFDWVVQHSAKARSYPATLARLQIARWQMQQETADPHKIAVQLKDLVLQRTLANEPLHLEAALDYIELQTKQEGLDKKWALLQKTKADFSSQEELLSKDYQEARAKLPLKNKIYEGYMQLIEAESLAIQAKLSKESEEAPKWQERAGQLLQQILADNAHPDLVARARKVEIDR